ncbi:MAG: endolytic transglycosylase MltG [candidate division Zixibacteria bacterium]|nr:endolytic transglycosylase MltG [candidate division Zixibacteria bacterium]
MRFDRVKFTILVFATAVALAVLGAVGLYILSAPVQITSPVTVTIARGDGTRQIAAKLDSLGILRSRRLFAWWARRRHIDRNLRPGRYIFSGPTRMQDILDLLHDGRAVTVSVTIPEGWATARMAGLLGRELGFDSAGFVALARDTVRLRQWGVPTDRLEGYLWPETYSFYWGVDPQEILTRLLQAARDEFGDSLLGRATRIGMSRHEILTLASMIEAEAAEGNERMRISSVFHNRLRLGMLLQCDPTVVYAIGGLPDGRLLQAGDLTFDSPYNTYLYPGLPPGPICNPGRSSILAALYPDSTKELYFVANGHGAHVFSETLNQHNRARAMFKKGLRVGAGGPQTRKSDVRP